MLRQSDVELSWRTWAGSVRDLNRRAPMTTSHLIHTPTEPEDDYVLMGSMHSHPRNAE